MIRNYFKIALRNLLRQKGYSFINVFGLSFGLTCCLLITLYVRYEISYDRHHEHAEHIYRVVEDVIRPNETIRLASAAAPIGPRLAHEFPEILHAVRFKQATMLIQNGEKRFQEDKIYFADSTVFGVFTYPLLKGDPGTALSTPRSIILSASAARKYFGDTDPIGQTLLIDTDNPFTVTGVFQDIRPNSHLHFDFLLSMSTLEKNGPGSSDGWVWSVYTYVKLAPGYKATDLEKKLSQFIKRQSDDEMLRKDHHRALSLQPLTNIHLHSKRAGEPSSGSLSNLYLFSFIGIFILLIACINFVNLTTAQAAKRAREVGMRKAIGGTRSQLILQFLAESVLLSIGASIMALGLCNLLLPVFSDLIGLSIPMDVFANPLAILVFLSVSLIVGCLAGSYPAFFLAGFAPAIVLKGILPSSSHGSFLRKTLIVLQFTISIVLIVGTVTVFTQLRFMQNQNLGYNQEQMLVLSFGDDDYVQQKVEVIKQELLRSPYIDKAAVSSHVPGKKPGVRRVEAENASGAIQAIDMHVLAVDYDFIPLYEIKLLAGRDFSMQHGSDATDSYMINEAATRELGFVHSNEAVGKELMLDLNRGTIISVVKDFHYTSLHEQIEPLLIRMRSRSLSYISIPIPPGAITATMDDLEKRWQVLAPHRPFDYFFLDEKFNHQYRADSQFGKAFGVSAITAIILACLGLFGLVSFTVQQRTKEIGIRKVVGATVVSVVTLLSKDFIKLVLISVFTATPIAWYGMDMWLQNFAYRIELQWWMFALAGLLAVIIALTTVSFQSVKAALMNPVRSLRSE
jgi:putative ABC transport system permease protein